MIWYSLYDVSTCLANLTQGDASSACFGILSTSGYCMHSARMSCVVLNPWPCTGLGEQLGMCIFAYLGAYGCSSFEHALGTG